LSPPSAELRDYLGLPVIQGVIIEEVFADMPAAKAGLKAKDIVLKLNGVAVPSDLDKALKTFDNVNDESGADFTVLRRGKEMLIKGIKPQPRSTTATGAGDFETIQLKHARAGDIAKLLDEAFNGPKAAGSPAGATGAHSPPPGEGKATTGGATTHTDRIRVVADPATNVLLVRASPLDMLTIRRLVEKLDAGATQPNPAKRY
jgi:type II secretory pathway component GspD/PulD (secretin)